ncbi:hypothetical protein KIN20_029957 [Parelaphostrongylus tenuis]|uniref:Reverse transcriptase domain-containing protein n=1 Tax=Parelaphostrongylus tenuis TaxID=148309 RepID=A0AAD5R385_PARTN|nr:hypothetical protein KIN20_029957 [Parelaphostrongylus tenuis]
MLKKLNEAGKKIGLRINRIKTQFIKNQWFSDKHIRLDGFLITETFSHEYLGRLLIKENSMKEELDRRRKAA